MGNALSKLSVVIPALNAESSLGRTIACVCEPVDGAPGEVIVVDGGSTDRTGDVARSAGATVMTAPRGRGSQLGAGGDAAHGDWLLFLHADTCLGPGWRAAVAEFMEHAGADSAGAFRLRFDDRAAPARVLERLVALRVRIFGLPYGDQGLLISAARYAALGGYRKLPLMEDVDMIRRIGRRRVARLDADAVTSAARYRRSGYLRRSLRNVLCLALYFLGVPPERLVRLYQGAA